MRSTRSAPRAVAALVVALGLLLAGCGGGAGEGDAGAGSGPTRTFAADNGPVEIPVRPQRIATLGSTFVPALEAGISPVAVSTLGWASADFRQWYTADQFARYEGAVKVGQASEVDYEALASARPDLITVSVPNFAWPRFDAQRLNSIAPTVFLATDIRQWKKVGERLADALGTPESFTAQRAAYDRKAEEIRTRHADLLRSTTFVSVNRYASTDPGSFIQDSTNGYCAFNALDAGVQVQPLEGTAANGRPVSLELMGTLARYGAIIYPVNADGSTKRDFVPVTQSGAWTSLPQVASGRTVGVRCSELLTYPHGLDYLQSLDDALGRMPKTG